MAIHLPQKEPKYFTCTADCGPISSDSGCCQNAQDTTERLLLSGGEENTTNLAHLRAVPTYSALQMTRGGRRLSTDS